MNKLTSITEAEARHIEGYAEALENIVRDLTGDGLSNKRYDPMTVDLERNVMHSYAFNMKDGGRHHPLSDYGSVEEIKDVLRNEALSIIKEEGDTAALKLEIEALKALPPNYTYWGAEECDPLDAVTTDLILFRDGKWDTSGFANNGRIGGAYPAAVYRGTETHLKFFDRYF